MKCVRKHGEQKAEHIATADQPRKSQFNKIMIKRTRLSGARRSIFRHISVLSHAS